jgi:hypothetical protein
MNWIPPTKARRIFVHWRKSRVYDIPVIPLCAHRRELVDLVDSRWKYWVSPASRAKRESPHRFLGDIIVSAN